MAKEEVKKEVSIWDRLDTPIRYDGRSITLPNSPEEMPTEKAIEALQRKLEDENQMFQTSEIIDAHPLDGAVAFYKAMVQLYGWASPQTVRTFFGPKPPTMLSVQVGPELEDVIQCPIGRFLLPGVKEPVNATFGENEKGQPAFVIYGEVKKKDRHVLIELAKVTREILKASSIYRGKPIRIAVNEDGELQLRQSPEFLKVSDITTANLIFDDVVMGQIETNILVPIREAATCRQYGIPVKRSILLAGPYGTGKSLTARLVAREGELHGWTFILLDKVQGLREALEFAKRYAPAIVFAEDIDRIASERDEEMNDLINTIDGVVSKTTEVMTVLTTNHADKLNPVILRPGRLDAVISITTPSPKTVERLLRFYGGALISAQEDLTTAGEALADQIPATIREAIDRAKLSMIGRKGNTLIAQDIVVAAKTMKDQLDLLNRKLPVETNAEKLERALQAAIGNGGNGFDHSMLGVIDDKAGIAASYARKAQGDTVAIRRKIGAV